MNENKRYLSLDNKLLIAVAVVSLLASLVISSINLVIDYRSEKAGLNQKIESIRHLFEDSVTLALWNMDENVLKSQLKGIVTQDVISRVEVFDDYANKVTEINKNYVSSRTYELHKIDLVYKLDSSHVKIGTLVVYVDTMFIRSEIMNSVLTIFVANMLTNLLIVFAVFFIFRTLVVKHLKKISSFLTHRPVNDPYHGVLQLERKTRIDDELSVLEDSINSYLKGSREFKNQILSLKIKAEESNRLKGLFLANISHELRTPLGAIIGLIDVIEETKNEEERKDLIKIQSKAASQLMNLVNDILDLTKIEASEFKLRYERFSLIDTVKSCISMLDRDFKLNKNQCLVFISSYFPKYIMGDEGRVTQTILNLLTNANKFTDKGKVTVSLSVQHKNIIIEVSDTGSGISEEMQTKIFEPFVQAETSTQKNRRGFGIGLSVTKRIVEAQGGELKLTSTIAKGSVFKITLPLIEAQMQDEENEVLREKQVEKVDNRSLNVLIVDDTEENRILLNAYLKNTPHKLYFAENGQEAVDVYKKEILDLIFMDIQMPVMDGFQATEEIRKLEEQKNQTLNSTFKVQIVALSAFQQKTDIERAYRAGCDEYLYKPIQKKAFLEFMSKYSNPSKQVS